jgi:PAS domain S-box-containing protein
MERKRLENEAEAQTPLPQLHRKTSTPAATSLPAQDPHARDATLDPSAGPKGEDSSWIGAGVAMKLPARMRDVIKRYGLALALASLALFLRGELPLREGTGVYQLSIAAVVLSAWYGGRGPGLLSALICATGTLYWLIPPVDSFELPADYGLGFLIFVSLSVLLSEFSAGRRRVEQALRTTEERFRALVQFSFDVWYWETDAQHRFTRQELSERPSDAPPFPRAEIGKTRWEHPHVDADEQGWREHRATIDAHLPFRDFERAIPIADGRTVYHSISGMPMFDPSGRFVGYRGVGRDITERKRAEAEHREHVWFLESMDRIHRAIQGSNQLETMINAVLGEVRDIFQADRALFSVFGTRSGTLWYRRLAIKLRPGCEHPDKVGVEYIADEDSVVMRSEVRAAGRPVALVLGSVPPHVARSHRHFGVESVLSMAIEARLAGLEHDDFYSFTLDECSRRRVWTAEEMRLFEEIGRRLGDALTKLSALGDLQRRDAYLSEAQRLSRSASWAWNAARKAFVHWSRGRLPLLGPESAQFPTLEDVRQSIHPEDRDTWSERFERAIRERSGFEFEYRSLLPDGTVKHFRTVGHPVLDGAGELVEFVGTVIDITAEKRAEAEQRLHVWFLESMDRIHRVMHGTNDVERMASNVLEAVLEIFDCDRAWLLYPCDPDAPSWWPVMEHTRPDFPRVSVPPHGLPMTAAHADVARAALACGGALPAGPGHGREVEPEIAAQFGVRSKMLMALQPKGDRPYLFGLHQCSRARIWTKEEQRLFEEIGRRLTEALSSLIAFRSLRESERRSEAAQKIAHVGWWERDYVGGRVSLSDEACRIFGVQPLDLPQWQDRWVSLIHPEDREKTAAASEMALSDGPRYDVEYRVVRPDGTMRVVHSQGDVTWDEEGRPVRQFGAMQDVTEWRQAEDELSEVKERFRVLAESALTGIYVTHMDRFSYVNPAFARMFGYTVEEIVDRLGSLDLTYPEDRQLVADNMRRRLDGEVEDLRYEFRGLRKDGSVFPVEVHGRRVNFGGKTGVLGTLIDNTQRKRAEDELRASEARFRTFVDHARDAFFLIDEHLRVVDVNRQACEGLGYRREQLIGMHPRDFDVGLDEPSIGRLAERAEAGEVITFETRHRRQDGTKFPVEIRSGTFRQGGKLFYLALARDITERKLAEESLRQTQAYLTESQRLSHTGSWALDVSNNRYLYTSEEFDRLFGFDSQVEAPTREAVLERMHPADRDTWKRHLEKSLGEKVDTTSQYRIMLPDGTVRHIHTIRHPVVNGAGQVVKLVGTSIDITERKQAEEERERLRRLEAELAHANRLNTLGELTTSIAHEVSQPLGAMVAGAGACARWLAADPPAMAEAQTALANIVSDGKRARDVIARIRTLAKRQAPRTDLLDVNRKILDVLSFVEQELDSLEVVLETRLDSALPKVLGDRVQLQQVILNLVKNAVEAMSGVNDRRRELTIVSARRPDGVVVEVRDSGIGLDPHGAERLFEAFYTTKPEGLGIGLSISRSIVEAHGGRLWAAPSEPHGAIFAFSLPIANEAKS